MKNAVVALVILFSASALGAPKKIVVMPVQATGLAPEIATEATEQERARAMSLAPTLGLLVMSKKTFDAMSIEKKLPTCADTDCEVSAAQRLGTDFVLTAKVIKDGSGFLITTKLFDVATGQQVAVRNVGATSLAELLGQVSKNAEDTLRAGLSPPPASAAPAPLPAAQRPAEDTSAVLLHGSAAFGVDNDLFGKNGILTLYADRLEFQQTGMNFSNPTTVMHISDMSSVHVAGDEVLVQMRYGKKYRVTARNNAEWAAAIEKRISTRRQ